MPIFVIGNRYGDRQIPGITGHCVGAEDADDALRIAEKYGIANPFGRKVANRRVSCRISFEKAKRRRGEIWYEENGELKTMDKNVEEGKENIVQIMDEIILDDGKYRFYVRDHILYCDRYGEDWREFIGDNALHELFNECLELKQQLLIIDKNKGKNMGKNKENIGQVCEPYLKFFIRKKGKSPWNTYRECYLWHLKELVDYYFAWGKDGFLSEHLKESEIEGKASRAAVESWAARDVQLTFDSVAIDPLTDEMKIKEIEGREDFVRWVGKEESFEIKENV